MHIVDMYDYSLDISDVDIYYPNEDKNRIGLGWDKLHV